MTDVKKVSKEVEEKTNNLIDKIKALVKEGNVSLIRLKKNDKVVVEFPVTLGVAGAFIGVAAVPWAVIIGAIALIGLDCKVEIVKKDGEIEVLEANDEELAFPEADVEEKAVCPEADEEECDVPEAAEDETI